MALNPDQYRLSESEHQAIFERRIQPNIFANAQPSVLPVAVIFGGQPGAGKSAAVDVAIEELDARGGCVQIIGDDLRDYHPKYATLMKADDKTAAFYTDRDTGSWVEKAIAQAKEQRVNLVIEGTMRNSDVVAETMQSLREAGYQIEARALAVNPRLSEQGIMQRYEKQKESRGVGRMTTPEAHQAAYDGMLHTLDRIEKQKLADRVSIYRRGAEVIYSNELQNGHWLRPPAARAAVEAERTRPMTLQERRDYVKGFDALADMMAKPERQASGEDIRKIADLRQQAKMALVAEVFRHESPESATKQFPELAPAYAYVRACEAKTQADGVTDKARVAVMARVRENVAGRIENGDIPSVHIREERQVEVSQQRDRAR